MKIVRTSMLYIASDHAGFQLKEYLKQFLTVRGCDFRDLGAYTYEKNDDYPDFAFPLAKKVAMERGGRGILICGSGQGVCIAANRIPGARAASAWNTKSAALARSDDNVNILCLGAQLLSKKNAALVVQTWLTTSFSNLARHKRRLKKIDASKKYSH